MTSTGSSHTTLTTSKCHRKSSSKWASMVLAPSEERTQFESTGRPPLSEFLISNSHCEGSFVVRVPSSFITMAPEELVLRSSSLMPMEKSFARLLITILNSTTEMNHLAAIPNPTCAPKSRTRIHKAQT